MRGKVKLSVCRIMGLPESWIQFFSCHGASTQPKRRKHSGSESGGVGQ